MSYSPRIFDVTSMDEAKRIILTSRTGQTEERWKKETPYLVSLIDKTIPISSDSIVLDYGCGVGRMSKVLIDKYRCFVVGVDISPSMRKLSVEYVNSDHFIAIAPAEMTNSEFAMSFDVALAIWVLQHCDKVEDDVNRIADAMKPGGDLFLLNAHNRYVPVDTRRIWEDDGKNVQAVLGTRFFMHTGFVLDPEHISEFTAGRSYCSTWRKS
jgi:SAM-dependent methyltransferase